MNNFSERIWEKYIIRKETIQNMGLEKELPDNNPVKIKFINRLKNLVKRKISEICKGCKKGF